MLKRLNDALPELVLGIIVYGIVVELAGVWFVTDKLRYTTGLVIGIALAVGMAVIAKSILRYVIVVIVFFVMMKFNLGNLFTAFIGVLGLKISAYLQPFTHKFVLKLQGRVETPSESSDN